MSQHLNNEVKKALATLHVPDVSLWSFGIEAHPEVYAGPFSAVHLFSYVVRAPILAPPRPPGSLGPKLVCTFHFTVRSGVVVQVSREGGDTVRVWVSMNAASYKPATLPVRHDAQISLADIKANKAEAAQTIDQFLAANYLTKVGLGLQGAALAAWLQSQGITYDRYAAPLAASIHDGEIIESRVEALGSGQQFSVDDDQPFPIYGWLRLEWQPFIVDHHVVTHSH